MLMTGIVAKVPHHRFIHPKGDSCTDSVMFVFMVEIYKRMYFFSEVKSSHYINKILVFGKFLLFRKPTIFAGSSEI